MHIHARTKQYKKAHNTNNKKSTTAKPRKDVCNGQATLHASFRAFVFAVRRLSACICGRRCAVLAP